MKLKYKNLIDVVEMSPNYFDFIIDNETVFTSEMFMNECEVNYNDLSVFYYKDSASDIQMLNYFKKCFDTWKNEIGYNVSRFFKGLKEEYNPIENYDRRESGGWIDELHKGSKTSNNVDMKTSNAFDSTTTPTEKTKTSNYIVGDDNENALLDGYTENETLSGNTKTTGSADNNYTETKANATNNYTTIEDISDNKFDKNVHVFDEYRVHGNIGVSTSSDMLIKEYDLRRRNYVSELIFDFITKHTLYVESW